MLTYLFFTDFVYAPLFENVSGSIQNKIEMSNKYRFRKDKDRNI